MAGKKTTALVKQGDVPTLYANKHFKITPIGLRVEGMPTYEDWASFGGVIASLGSAAQWAIGDWLVYGEGRGDYGEMYSQAIDATGRSYSGLANAAWICKRFEFSARAENLSFRHHIEVAKLEADVAARLLKQAERERWNVDQLRDARIALKHSELASRPIPDGQYRVIYADPPWFYATPQYGTDVLHKEIADHYPSMPTDAICALPVPAMALPNSVLFLWATSPLLFEAELVINAWGFDYKASIVWDKVKHNVGHYVSVRHEFLLICTKGSCLPDSHELLDSVVSIEKTVHSRKPEEFRAMIDAMYVPVPHDRIELFARGGVPEHWRTWGNE